MAHQVTERYGRIFVLLMTVALPMLAGPAGALTWTSTIVDGTYNVGGDSSLAITNGNPSISYYDSTNGDLKYVRATDADGTAWGTPVTVDSTGATGISTSLAITNGNPSISYFDATNGDLKYVRATDADGTAWGTPVTVDSTTDTGLYSSLAITDGNPSISYFDSTNGDLKYVRAVDASGTAWGTPVTVDSTTDTGQYTSLAIANGNPSISYYDVTNGDLKYVRAADASGTVWGTPVTVDSTMDAGQYTTLAIANGNPSISYYDVTNGDLKYVRAADASGTVWGTPVTVDSTMDAGQYTSLAIINGNPSISYYDSTNGDLKYVRATDADGTAWGTPEIVDSVGAGSYTSLAIINGNPSISYLDPSNGDLKYARGGTGPLSSFTASPSGGDAPLMVTFTDTSNGGPTGYSWNFGSWSAADGGVSTQMNPVHTYDSPGTYVVTLMVQNANGGDTFSRTITVTDPDPHLPPVSSFTATPASGDAPLMVTFTDTTTGGPTGYDWNFGSWSAADGGVSTQMNPVHTYDSPGTYVVTLTVQNAEGGNTFSQTITVSDPDPHLPPVSGFTASPSGGDAPLMVTFTDTSYGGPTGYSWNFGSWSAADGGVSTQPNPVHTYDSPGTYVVTLMVQNANGGDTFSRTITVTDPDPHLPPVSSFTATPASGDAPLMVTFTDTTTGGPTGYDWNFGSWSAADGGVSTQPNPVHTYDSPGTYVVTLMVQNANGGDTSSQTITVVSSGSAATALEVDPVQPATVYAGIDGSGVYRSPDSGSSWTHLTLPTGANLRIRALAPVRLAVSTATTLYAGSYGGGVYRSTDGGASWDSCGALPDQNVLSLAANSTAGVYAGTESGVYASTDGCSSWTPVNNGLP